MLKLHMCSVLSNALCIMRETLRMIRYHPKYFVRSCEILYSNFSIGVATPFCDGGAIASKEKMGVFSFRKDMN